LQKRKRKMINKLHARCDRCGAILPEIGTFEIKTFENTCPMSTVEVCKICMENFTFWYNVKPPKDKDE